MGRTVSAGAATRSGSKRTMKNTSKVTSKSKGSKNNNESKARKSLGRSLKKHFSNVSDSKLKIIENTIVKNVLEREQDSWYKARRNGRTKENWLASEVKNYEKKYTKTHYYSTSEERMKRIPREKNELVGKWTGERGNSTFIPKETDKNKEMLAFFKENNIEGIDYKDCIPDFSPIAERTVEIPDMTEYRFFRPDKKPGNFEQAYTVLAEQFNAEKKEDKTDWTSDSVKDWAKDPSKHNNHVLIVHERCDTKTCDFVRDDVHAFFTHTGGCYECKIRDEQNHRWDEFNKLDDNGGFDE